MADYRETVEKLRTMRAHFDSLLGTLTHDERATFDETVALLTEQDAELATLRQEQRDHESLIADMQEQLDEAKAELTTLRAENARLQSAWRSAEAHVTALTRGAR